MAGWLAVGVPDRSLADESLIKVELQTRRTWSFGNVHFSNEFSGARLNGCEQISEHEYKGAHPGTAPD